MKKYLTILLVSILFFGCKKENTANSNLSLPILTTKSVISIFQTTITCGGEISSDGGSPVTARGLCWSTSPNPGITDHHTTDGSGTGSFISYLTNLSYDSAYYIRAYATNSEGTAYGNEINSHVPPLPLEVYVAGQNAGVATIWKNGIATALRNTGSQATSVYISGDDIYVAGILNAGGGMDERAVVWKNGIETILSNGQHQAFGLSVFVNNDDVYVTGFEFDDNGVSIAKFWKNGVENLLTDGTHDAEAHAIYVEGTDLYAAGFEDVTGPADVDIKVWKNGIPTTLGNTTDPGSGFLWGHCDIKKSGNDVYVTARVRGASASRATVWKNGVPVVLSPFTNGSGSKSVFISGNDVYVAGYTLNNFFQNIPTCWKNGTPTFYPAEPGGNTSAEDVFVLGSDVYVTGYQSTFNFEKLMVWKNGVPNAWTDGVTNYAMGASIFVKNP